MSDCEQTLAEEQAQTLLPSRRVSQAHPDCSHQLDLSLPEAGGSAVYPSPVYITRTLQALDEIGFANYAPVKFRYLQALAKRVGSPQSPVPVLMLEKIATALEDYQQAFLQARRVAVEQLQQIGERFPDSADQADDYFNRYEFVKLGKLYDSLLRNETRQASGLKDITRILIQGLAEDKGGSQLEDSLLRQEQETMQAVLEQNGIKESAQAAQLAALELSSVRRFRETCVQIHASKVVSNALDDRPENPGPLNPQMLTIRSLAMLRDLSPEYLNRFVSYIDTMLWLEQSGAKSEPSKKSRNSK